MKKCKGKINTGKVSCCVCNWDIVAPDIIYGLVGKYRTLLCCSVDCQKHAKENDFMYEPYKGYGYSITF